MNRLKTFVFFSRKTESVTGWANIHQSEIHKFKTPEEICFCADDLWEAEK